MQLDPPGKRKLRPLPSVDMALLPEDVRNRRVRRTVFGGLVAALLLGAVLVWASQSLLPQVWDWARSLFVDAEESAEATPELAVLAPAEEVGPPWPAANATTDPATLAAARLEPNARYTTEFGRAPSFRQALLNAGLAAEECNLVEQGLRNVVDFRRCRPEHKLVIARDEQGELEHFEYHPSQTEFVELKRDDLGRFRAEQIRIKVERTPIARAGSVQTSIGDALKEIGLPDGLAVFFVEAFEGRINFALHARKGDVFRIIVDEERVEDHLLRYGRVHAIEYHGQHTGLVRAFFYDDGKSTPQFYDETGRAMQGGWLRTPLRYERLSSRYNPRRFHPILKRTVPHLGVDYAAATGTPVWAAGDGVVKFAGRKGANGNLVVIRHGGGAETFYAHLHRIKAGISPRKRVKQRELIGFVGSTGRSTGPHLHFGLKKKGRFVDPAGELNGPGLKMSAAQLPAYREQMAKWIDALQGIEDVPDIVEGSDEPLAEPVDEVMD